MKRNNIPLDPDIYKDSAWEWDDNNALPKVCAGDERFDCNLGNYVNVDTLYLDQDGDGVGDGDWPWEGPGDPAYAAFSVLDVDILD